jgi:hypothetical protein
MIQAPTRRPWFLAVALLLALGCGDRTTQGIRDDAGAADGSATDAVTRSDAGTGPEGGSPGTDDGTPTRQPCTTHFGSGLTTDHGRLDGILVAIVPPGHSGCTADSDHIKLQVLAGGAVYDVAVTVVSSGTDPDVFYAETDGALPTEPWSEGWHAEEPLDYALSLGVHSGSFTATPKAQLTQQVTGALAGVNHISVYGTGYGPDGMHLVHRNSGLDGAIVIRPLAATPHFLLFRFSDQSF